MDVVDATTGRIRAKVARVGNPADAGPVCRGGGTGTRRMIGRYQNQPKIKIPRPYQSRIIPDDRPIQRIPLHRLLPASRISRWMSSTCSS